MNDSKLTRQQKEAIGLLSIGTFLEYFDLMLYVHMAVLLNDLFFPQTNPFTVQLLAATTFCLTYILRPVGGAAIGWIGDNIGRKNTIIMTTFTMSLCCVVMANLKNYAEIGIMATIILIICRILQGFSSLGEVLGAQLYLTEKLKQPNRYISTGIMEIRARTGGLFALGVANFALTKDLNWRLAFWIGAIIAIVGFIARTKLRETNEYTNFQSRMKLKNESFNKSNDQSKFTKMLHDIKIDKGVFLGIL